MHVIKIITMITYEAYLQDTWTHDNLFTVNVDYTRCIIEASKHWWSEFASLLKHYYKHNVFGEVFSVLSKMPLAEVILSHFILILEDTTIVGTLMGYCT